MTEMATPVSAPSPPTRERIKGWIAFLFFAFLLAGLTAAAIPWLFSTNMLRKEMLAQIRQVTGLAAVSEGHAVFVILPQPHLSIEEIRLADPSGALRIEARYLKGYLRVSSLLRGRLEVAWATLGEPQMTIDLDRRSLPSDSAIGRAAQAKSASPQADVADDARLGVVSIVNGGARLTARLGRADVLIDAINATVDWRRLGSAASVAGTLRFRGQAADIAAVIERPTELMRGGQSDVSLKINGRALTLSAEGRLATGPVATFTGRAAAAAPSLRQLIETGGYFIDLPAPFEDFAMNSEASIGADGASFSNLHLRLDGNAYEGALAVMIGEQRPILSGTLAADSLSLRPFIADRGLDLARDGQWSRDAFETPPEQFADVDLRLSAARLTLPGIELEDAAFSVMNRKDRLDVALIEARAYQGNLKGRASFVKAGGAVEMRASATVSDVDVAAVWPNSTDSWRFAGSLSAAGNVESAGLSVSELMRNLNGRAQVEVARGVLGGVNLDQALRWIDKRPLGLADDLRYGGTGFEQARFGLRIAGGVAEIEEGATMTSPSFDLGFGGSFDIGDRALNVHATATGAGGALKPGREPAKFSFDIAGSWDDIALIPDARSLIRQSGAAAPLFSPNRVDIKAAPAAEGH
jgi:AsmA protein